MCFVAPLFSCWKAWIIYFFECTFLPAHYNNATFDSLLMKHFSTNYKHWTYLPKIFRKFNKLGILQENIKLVTNKFEKVRRLCWQFSAYISVKSFQTMPFLHSRSGQCEQLSQELVGNSTSRRHFCSYLCTCRYRRRERNRFLK